MVGLRWIIDGLGGSSAPEIYEIEAWCKLGVKAIVNLLEGEEGRQVAQKENEYFEVLHIEVEDFSAPDVETALEIIRWIDEKLKEGKKVVVHCRAGIGRTGTIICAYLVWKGKSLDEALRICGEMFMYPQSQKQMKFLEEIEALKLAEVCR